MTLLAVIIKRNSANPFSGGYFVIIRTRASIFFCDTTNFRENIVNKKYRMDTLEFL